MSEYHSIPNVWTRDMEGNKRLIINSWSTPEIAALKDCAWEATEKIDGMNIRVIVTDGAVSFGGKTDNAQIPAKLVARLRERFENNARLTEMKNAVLYGEGYGAGIQKGDGYGEHQDFILFDVRVGPYWLRRADVYGIADGLGVPFVPVVGTMTLDRGIDLVMKGFRSNINRGACQAEGLVMRAPEGVLDRGAHRIICKIKHRDFA